MRYNLLKGAASPIPSITWNHVYEVGAWIVYFLFMKKTYKDSRKLLSQFFKPVINITKKAKHISKCIELIVEESLPLKVIQKKSFRKFYSGAEQLLFSK